MSMEAVDVICRQCGRKLQAKHLPDDLLCRECRPARPRKQRTHLYDAKFQSGRSRSDSPNGGDYRFDAIVSQTDSGIGGGFRQWVGASCWSRDGINEMVAMANVTLRRVRRPVDVAVIRRRVVE